MEKPLSFQNYFGGEAGITPEDYSSAMESHDVFVGDYSRGIGRETKSRRQAKSSLFFYYMRKISKRFK